MTDFYYAQPAQRPSFWRRLFGLGGRDDAYAVPPYPPHVVDEPEPEPAPEPPPPASRNFHLSLPSEKPELEFRTVVHVNFEPNSPRMTADDPATLIRQDVYAIARDISSRLSLTEQEQLSYRITEQLLPRRPLAGVIYWGRCVSVEAKPAELELVRSIQQRKLAWESERHENWILERRIRSLNRIFDDPRTATIWWFAQHQDHLEELPLKAQMFADLDRWFNPRNVSAGPLQADDTEWWQTESDPEGPESNVVGSSDGPGSGADEPVPDPAIATDGQLLDQFLLDADEAGQAAVGVVLSRLYRENGRHDLADRIQRYTQPPTYVDSAGDAEFPDASREADPPGTRGPIAL